MIFCRTLRSISDGKMTRGRSDDVPKKRYSGSVTLFQFWFRWKIGFTIDAREVRVGLTYHGGDLHCCHCHTYLKSLSPNVFTMHDLGALFLPFFYLTLCKWTSIPMSYSSVINISIIISQIQKRGTFQEKCTVVTCLWSCCEDWRHQVQSTWQQEMLSQPQPSSFA